MMKVLIAEDSEVNRELLRELLEARGCEVTEARDGQEALEMIAVELPEVLLLDINMPRLDGLGAIQKLRENPRTASLPVLAVTAYAMRGDEEKILQAGFNGYLSKPIAAAVLGRELARVLGRPVGSESETAGNTSDQD
jgi:two-component system, cell cycle response regulator DivK